MENVEDDLPIEEPQEERVYSYREKALRDYFVNEYLVDYDALAAAVRIGYNKSIANEYAARFMAEPYVLREIQKKEGSNNANSDDPEVARKRIIAGLIRESNYRGPGSSQSARVAALSRLATLYEMDPKDKPKEPEDDESLAGTIVVPGMMTPEQWEAAAARQQEELVNGTIMPTPPSIN